MVYINSIPTYIHSPIFKRRPIYTHQNGNINTMYLNSIRVEGLKFRVFFQYICGHINPIGAKIGKYRTVTPRVQVPNNHILPKILTCITTILKPST